jgi:hypothetical protein
MRAGVLFGMRSTFLALETAAVTRAMPTCAHAYRGLTWQAVQRDRDPGRGRREEHDSRTPSLEARSAWMALGLVHAVGERPHDRDAAQLGCSAGRSVVQRSARGHTIATGSRLVEPVK